MRRVLINPITDADLPRSHGPRLRTQFAAVPAGVCRDALREDVKFWAADAAIYRVHGVPRLTRRIADRDPEGNYVNGYSDRVL